MGEAVCFSLDPELLLIYLCSEGAKDQWATLSRVAEVAALINRYPPSDWSRLYQQISAWGSPRVLTLGLAFVRQTLKLSFPEAETLIGQDRRIDKIVSRLFNPNEEDSTAGFLLRSAGFYYHMAPSVGYRALLPVGIVGRLFGRWRNKEALWKNKK